MSRRNQKFDVTLNQQLPLPLNLPDEITLDVIKANEAEIRSTVDLRVTEPVRPELPTLTLPRRYEALEAEAKVRNLPLRPLVRPVREALTDIEREIRLVKQMVMGRLYLINGVTGSGKTTFLNSLTLFLDGIKIYTVKGMSFENRGSVENALALLSREQDAISVVILEGREAPGSLRDAEIDVLLTTLNIDFRSDAGRRTLFVIPTTSSSLAQAISERAASIGE